MRVDLVERAQHHALEPFARLAADEDAPQPAFRRPCDSLLRVVDEDRRSRFDAGIREDRPVVRRARLPDVHEVAAVDPPELIADAEGT